MINSSVVLFFSLSGYLDLDLLKYLFFALVLLLYVSIVCANVLLILVICMNRSLHEPMYVFLCSLFVNELYGSTGLFPFLLVQLLSDLHLVSFSLCFLQIFCLYSYACVEFFNLAAMSYDRYLAICRPLRYHALMTRGKAAWLVVLVWFYGSLICLIPVAMAVPLPLCGNVINKVYCDNYNIVRLSCSDTSVNSFYGLAATALSTLVPFSLILFSYVKILKVCVHGSKRTRQKAFSTCLPHVFSLINFSFGAFFEIVQSRFNMTGLPHMSRVFLSLYWVMGQPLFNPLIHGLTMSTIRSCCKNLLTA